MTQNCDDITTWFANADNWEQWNNTLRISWVHVATCDRCREAKNAARVRIEGAKDAAHQTQGD